MLAQFRSTVSVTLAAVHLSLGAAPLFPQTMNESGSAAEEVDGRYEYGGAIAASSRILRAFVGSARLPALQVAVADDNETVWSEAFGFADVEQRVAATPLSRFRIGSVSKSLTAAAAALLWERGELDLDRPVRSYVPAFPDKGVPITSRELLGHLSGIRHYRDDEPRSRSQHFGTVEQALTLFADDPLVHEPGVEYSYSSYGYVLLSAVIEAVTGRDYPTVIREDVFEPLGMTHSSIDEVDSIIPFRVRFYEPTESGLRNSDFTDNSYKWASGGLLSTAEDLVRFGSGLIAGDLLRPETVDSMFSSMTSTSGEPTGYGMGWRPREDWEGRRVIHHGGGSVGGRAFLLIYPSQGLVIAMLSNRSLAPLFEEEAQTIAHFFLEHQATEETISEDRLQALAGSYDLQLATKDGEVEGRLLLSASKGGSGWLDWAGSDGPTPIVLIDSHGGEVRLVGAGARGLFNLWFSGTTETIHGRWNWLGRTLPVHGRRVSSG